MRALIIDDSSIFRRRMSCLLCFLGHSVCGMAEDGVIGAELVGMHRPDFVILDNELAGMRGVECVSLIRLANPGSRIILVSGGITPEEALELSRMGTDAVLLKPISEAKLANLLRGFSLMEQFSSPGESPALVRIEAGGSSGNSETDT
ncbi:response regulator [bacterium]|nr:response regulator [bacterium]